MSGSDVVIMASPVGKVDKIVLLCHQTVPFQLQLVPLAGMVPIIRIKGCGFFEWADKSLLVWAMWTFLFSY